MFLSSGGFVERAGRGRPVASGGVGSDVPAYITAMAANSGKQLTSANVEDAFGTFTNQAGSRQSLFAYSGAAYDTLRSRYMQMGEGHQDGNGNAVYALSIYASESPAWSRLKDYSTPPSATPQTTGPEAHDTLNGNTATGVGDPVGHHSYSNLVYDGYNDRLMLCGLGSVFSINGNSAARMRSLSSLGSTPPLWDALTARPSVTVAGQGGMAWYDPVDNVVWRKAMQQNSAGIDRYDCAADTLASIDDGLTSALDGTLTGDPTNRYMMAILKTYSGSGNVMLWNLDSYNGGAGTITGYSRTLGSFPAAINAGKVGLCFHPPSGYFVAWIGGNTIYLLIPPTDPFTGTWTFDTRTPGGDALPTISSSSFGGVYNRLQWAPYPDDSSQGVFIMCGVSGTDGAYSVLDTYLYKPNF